VRSCPLLKIQKDKQIMSFSMKSLLGNQPDQQQTPSQAPAPASGSQPSGQPAAPAASASQPTVINASPTSPKDPNSFSMTDLMGDQTKATQNAEQQAQSQKDAEDKQRMADLAKHGVLHRAWDWINMPVLDNVLPNDIKTSDIVKAAAFEKMFGEAYIPGVNDFDTKAKEHFEAAGPAKVGKKTEAGVTHPFVTSPETHAVRNAIKTFITGAAKDTSDMAAGFSSPLSLGTLALGSVAKGAGAIGKIAKVASPFVGTAFGLQGLWQAAHGGYKTATEGATPENVQETLGGLGQAALGAHSGAETAGQIGDTLRESVRPVNKTIAGQEIPVRPKGFAADVAAKSVTPDTVDKAATQTGTAVQRGVGNIAGEATGSEAETKVGTQDRFGIRSHAADLKGRATEAFQELDRLSGNAFSDAQKMQKNSSRDYSTEGREKVNEAKALQDQIIEAHRDELAENGFDVDEMKSNYRKAIALNKIADKLDTATGPKAGGGYEVDGEKLANQIDQLRRVSPDKNLFRRAGLTEDHINALAELADTLRQEQVQPKWGGLAKLAAKALAITSLGVGHGITGLAEALTGESMAEKLGSKLITRLLGDAMTSEPAARELNEALKGGPRALSNWKAFAPAVRNLLTQDDQEPEAQAQ
jgi:hypothetical protein